MTDLQVHAIDNACELIVESMPGEVISVRWEEKKDHADEDAMFFSVLLSDEAAKDRELFRVSTAVREMIWQSADPSELRMFNFCNFRSVSEQDRNPDAAFTPKEVACPTR